MSAVVPFVMNNPGPPEIVDVVALRGATLGPDLLRVRVRNASATCVAVINGTSVAPSVQEHDGTDACLWLPLASQRREDGLRVAIRNMAVGGGGLPFWQAERDVTVLGVGDAPVSGEGQIVRITRALLDALGRYAARDARLAYVVDLDARPGGVRMVPVSDGPALTLVGPRLDLPKVASEAHPIAETLLTNTGTTRAKRATGVALDLVYELTGTARGAPELVTALAAVATFIARTRWLELSRDPRVAGAPIVRWDLDADGAVQSQVLGGVHLFRIGLRVAGVVLDVPSSAAEGSP